jgi:hypothetical protein
MDREESGGYQSPPQVMSRYSDTSALGKLPLASFWHISEHSKLPKHYKLQNKQLLT